MCEECRTHGVDCTELMMSRASREQILRLLQDIFFRPPDLDGEPS